MNDELAPILELLRQRTGLVYPETRRDQIDAVIRTAMARAHCDDVAAFQTLLVSGVIGYDDLIDEGTVGETYFYRDPVHFQILRDEVLPELETRHGRRAVRAWSAGCASGEEAYSLAMLFEDHGFGDGATVFGSDLSLAALRKARRACYRSWSLRGTWRSLAERHLRRHDNLYCVEERIKRRVELGVLNLASELWPAREPFDVVFCRNVLIYLAPDRLGGIVERLFDSLSDGGWLFAGPSDPPLDGFGRFELEVRPEGNWYRRRPPRTPRPVVVSAAPAPLAPPAPKRPAPAPAPLPPDDLDDLDDLVGELSALANSAGSDIAERAVATALQTKPLDRDLHYLHAVLLSDLGRDHDALDAARRVLYLSSGTVVAMLLIAFLHRRLGDPGSARRVLLGAARLLASRPDAELVPLADGQTAGQLARVVERELEVAA